MFLLDLFFSKQFIAPDGHIIESLLKVLATFGLYCLVSGFVYIINDIADIERDRKDPDKMNRPLASGKIKVSVAIIIAVFIGASSLTLSYYLNPYLLIVFGIYIVMNLLYSKFLKHMVIIDIFIISIGFVLRALAGTIVIATEASYWLIICTFFLALVLASGKRRYELLHLVSDNKRPVIAEYSEQLINNIVIICSTLAVMTYSIYTVQNSNVIYLPLTIPLVLYGIFRYLFLLFRGGGGSPEKILIHDKHILLTVLFYVISTVLLIYFS